MNDFINLLNQDLQKGFIDKVTPAKGYYQPKLLLNSKERERTVLDDLIRDLQNCDYFWFSVAFLSTSGLATLIETLKELGQKGVKGKILVSEYQHWTQPEALRKLLKLEHIESRMIKHTFAFHQKGYMFKSGNEYSIIIGSSNLTQNALKVNSELNIRITATDNSQIIDDVMNEFKSAFEKAQVLNHTYIKEYEKEYEKRKNLKAKLIPPKKIDLEELVPNKMQQEALNILSQQRECGIKKSLIISATATGKTIMSAFDVKQTGANRCLFVVHRRNIAIKAKSEFKKVFGSSKTMGLYSGDQKNKDADFVFATIQTISKDKDLKLFKSDEFDYIIIDETHRAGAFTYQKLMDYFKPDFMLGMTATPERGDNFDIFKAFDNNIAYEIRLYEAMENKLVCPFHYYGVTDVTVNGKVLSEDSDFNLLVHNERVNRIIETVESYGTDNGVIRGLIFCSRVDEADTLSSLFNKKGYKTISLAGINTEEERQKAIEMLESDDCDEKLDYIFTVDIFNEGIDIPKINQIVMLRPTESVIIFVQQLGRGLRLHEQKEYLTFIDFIGNYKNSYLIPVALSGDSTGNKDTIRKGMSNPSLLPGPSTINFDPISKEQIFNSINDTNFSLLRDLRKDYIYLKSRLGRMPMMTDFLESKLRDPYHFIKNMKSYYNFVVSQEKDVDLELDLKSKKLLEYFALHVNNAKRLEESVLLLRLINEGEISISKFKEDVFKYLSDPPSDATVNSVINNLNLNYMTEYEKESNKKVPIGKLHGFDIARLDSENHKIYISSTLKESMLNPVFSQFLHDNTQYSISKYMDDYEPAKFKGGFVLYRKYERKDIHRILNWEKVPNPQTVGGYQLSKDKTLFPIFVTYKKAKNIPETTNYDDHFISKTEFAWMSKRKRTIKSPEIKWLLEHNDNCRIPLFVKKSDNEGKDYNYIGELIPDKKV